MLNPVWGTFLNFLVGLLGLAETTGLTNVLGTSGSKAGAVAAMVIAFTNAGLHGISSAAAGPLVPTSSPPPPTMRTLGLFFLGLLLLWPVAGQAADLKVKAPASSLYIDPWSPGIYAGAEIGYGMNLGREVFQGLDLGVESGAKAQGMLGGMHLGYGGRVSGPIYAGLEVNGDITGMNGGAGLSAVQASDKMDWLASARGRIGYIYDRVMLYGTGGWGWGGTKKDFLVIANGSDPTAKKVQNGFVWGLGAEYAITNQWLARVEYRQYIFGTVTAADSVASYTVHDNINTVLGGMTYKF